jgi:hypothetical protein
MYKDLLSRIPFPLSSQLHVLRHFLDMDDSYIEQLSTTQKKYIKNYMGSKFKEEFARSPLEIIPKTQEMGTLEYFINEQYRQIIMTFTFSKNDFPMGIGWDYSEHQSQELKPVATWKLNMFMHRNNNKWEITTCFPGERSLKKKEIRVKFKD